MIERAPTVRVSTALVSLLALTALCLSLPILAGAATRSDNLPGAVNVRDLGASGSEYETVASAVAGRRNITVRDPGDFMPGQEVMIKGAYVQYANQSIFGPGEPYATERPLRDEVEMRGYTGASGSWIVYILEIDGADPLTFRWSDDLAITWKGTK
ncbi:MAG: hypothetical protein ABSD48_14270, partial [Armatimonadota bacterium]